MIPFGHPNAVDPGGYQVVAEGRGVYYRYDTRICCQWRLVDIHSSERLSGPPPASENDILQAQVGTIEVAFADLAVDRGRNRAFVVPPGARFLAEVDLGRMRVRYRPLAKPLPAGSSEAELVGRSKLAIGVIANRRAVLLDTRTGRARELTGYGYIEPAGFRFVVYGYYGLSIFDTRGRERHRLFRRKDVTSVQVQGGIAYAKVRRPATPYRYAAIDLRRGRVLATVAFPTRTRLLIETK